MRIADSLDLPPELERARVAGELVVFAGAGVSIDPPSGLPSFQGLARLIAEPRIAWESDFGTSIDRYLGRAARAGIKVQERARALIDNGGTHTPLHEQLLGLFGSPERVRLITTNFDRHFLSAAEKTFPGCSLAHYIGPALPPGGRFAGVAQIHGALGHLQDSLVLTDADFADAYMADGWATRFLVRVFAARTVLFVGYSISDPLMQYLLRAIPQSQHWFAMWHESEVSEELAAAIQIVPFATSSDGRKYGDLHDGFRRWSWYARASVVDHDRELRRHIASGPPASPLDADYLRARLSTTEGRLVFWQYAKSAEWFRWVAEEGFLASLLQSTAVAERDSGWGYWCLEHFAGGDNPLLLQYLRGRSVQLSSEFTSELMHHLARCSSFPPAAVARQFVAFIVSQRGELRGGHDYSFEWLLRRIVDEGMPQLTVAILDYGTRVQLETLERFFLAYEQKDAGSDSLPSLSTRVRTVAPPRALVSFVRKSGPRLGAAEVMSVLDLGERRIVEASELLELARGAEDRIEWLSYGRTAIAPSDQDLSEGAEDALVELVRFAIDRLAQTDPAIIRDFADRNRAAKQTLLRRLALYGYSLCDASHTKQILNLGVDSKWGRDLWVRPELYLLVTAHYGRADPADRAAFVRAIRHDDWWDIDEEEYSPHARFSMAQLLARIAPACRVAGDFAREERERWPDWSEGDRDGYLSRVETGWGGEGPSLYSCEQLLEFEATAAIDKITQVLNAAARHAQGHSLLGAVQQAVRSRPAWGIDLWLALENPQGSSERIVESVLYGLREAETPRDERLRLLASVADRTFPEEILRALARVSVKWANGLGRSADSEMHDALDRVATILYRCATTTRAGIVGRGWTESAMNHPAGAAANIWWQVGEARNWVDGSFVLSISDVEKKRWEMIVADDTLSGAYARPYLGMATDRLSSGDYPWAEKHIFPAFDVGSNRERAIQLWDGRLMQNLWSNATVEALRPSFEPLFADLSGLLPARSRQLGAWVAFLAVEGDDSWMSLPLLHLFVQNSDEVARIEFARRVSKHLGSLNPNDRVACWERLLKPLWRDRHTNMPSPLANDEVREMMSWVRALPEVEMEALSLLEAAPLDEMPHSDSILWSLNEDQAWVTEHATTAVRLIAFLGKRRSIQSWSANDAVALLQLAFDSGASKEQVIAALETIAHVSRSAVAMTERLRGLS